MYIIYCNIPVQSHPPNTTCLYTAYTMHGTPIHEQIQYSTRVFIGRYLMYQRLSTCLLVIDCSIPIYNSILVFDSCYALYPQSSITLFYGQILAICPFSQVILWFYPHIWGSKAPKRSTLAPFNAAMAGVTPMPPAKKTMCFGSCFCRRYSPLGSSRGENSPAEGQTGQMMVNNTIG